MWKNNESTVRLFADDCLMYRKILNNNEVKKLLFDLNRLEDWALEMR
jgi:hypothetical protein